MKYYHYYIELDLIWAGLFFLVYFTIFSVLGLLIAINFKFQLNRSSSLLKNSLKPFLYRIPNHVEHSKKYIDFIEYESYKKLIQKIEEIEDLKKNLNRKGIKFLPAFERRRILKGTEDIDQSRFFGGRGVYDVNENLWRGFKSQMPLVIPKGGSSALSKTQGDQGSGVPNPEEVFSASQRKKGNRYENLKRRKNDGSSRVSK